MHTLTQRVLDSGRSSTVVDKPRARLGTSLWRILNQPLYGKENISHFCRRTRGTDALVKVK